MATPERIVFQVSFPGDSSAGMLPYSDTIRMEVESGNVSGEPGEFVELLRQTLSEWYDGATVEIDPALSEMGMMDQKPIGLVEAAKELVAVTDNIAKFVGHIPSHFMIASERIEFLRSALAECGEWERVTPETPSAMLNSDGSLERLALEEIDCYWPGAEVWRRKEK